jgi:DNA repair photolyase
MSSVTDPYHQIEIKYKLTRRILEKLISLQPNLNILTKSDLVLRDIDLLRQFKKCLVTIFLSALDEKIRRQLEPLAVSAERRIKALKQFHKIGLKTAIFISPILPSFTNWQGIINKTKFFVDEYWFENLNPYFSIRDNILRFLRKNNPELSSKYKKIWTGKSNCWSEEEKKIKQFCRNNKVVCKIYFHHKRKN